MNFAEQPPASAPSSIARQLDRRLLQPLDMLLAAGAGLLAGIIYWLGTAPGVLMGDGGELQFAAWTAGLPHPTGYPLYMLLGWAWTHLLSAFNLATPARAMNLLSAAFAALAVGLAYLLAHALVEISTPRAPHVAQRLAGLLAALTFAFTPTFWSQALVTEVYTLHAALLALILGLALRWQKGLLLEQAASAGTERKAGGALPPLTFRSRPAPPLMLLALALGLGLAHHRTIFLLVPVLIVFIWRQDGYRLRHPRWLIVLGLLAGLPLLLYLYIPLRAPHTPYLQVQLTPDHVLQLVDQSPRGLLDYTLGTAFAGELQGLSKAIDGAPNALERFVSELGWIGIGLALLGILHLVVSGQRRLLWLTGGNFLLLTGFNLAYTIGDIQVFYIGPYLIACCWIGVGAAMAAQEVTLFLQRRNIRIEGVSLAAGDHFTTWLVSGLLFVPLVALPLSLFLEHAAAVDRSGHTRPGEWWSQLLASEPPPDAVLITNDRDEMMPLWYAQQVDGVRPDLTGIFPGLLPDSSWSDVGKVLDQALATGRPVALIKPMPGLEVKAHLGLNNAAGLVPVEGPAVTQAPQRSQDAVIGDVMRLVGYDVAPVAAQPGDTLRVDVQWQPLRRVPANLTSYVHLLSPDGTRLTQSDKLLGGVYYPTSLWEPGDVLLDRHELAIPADAPPGPYRLVSGLYELRGEETLTVGEVSLTGSVGGEHPAKVDDNGVNNPVYANFDNQALLIGYDLAGPRLATTLPVAPESSSLAPNELQIRLLWQPARPMAQDYTLFVHLVDDQGRIVSQIDTLPFGGRYPTSVWQQGELLVGRVVLSLPRDLPPGMYRLVVGLYDAQDPAQDRLPAFDDRGQRFPNDQLDLSTVELN